MRSKSKAMLILLIIFVFISILFPYNLFANFEDGMVITRDELNDIQYNNVLLTSNIACVSASSNDKFDEYIINYKLLNLFNVKKLKVNVIVMYV